MPTDGPDGLSVAHQNLRGGEGVNNNARPPLIAFEAVEEDLDVCGCQPGTGQVGKGRQVLALGQRAQARVHWPVHLRGWVAGVQSAWLHGQ